MFIPNIRSETALLLSGVAAITTVSPVQADHYVLGVCQTATQSVGTEITPTIDADSYLVNYHEDVLRYKKFSFDSERRSESNSAQSTCAWQSGLSRYPQSS